jgi:hypothetical protein
MEDEVRTYIYLLVIKGKPHNSNFPKKQENFITIWKEHGRIRGYELGLLFFSLYTMPTINLLNKTYTNN